MTENKHRVSIRMRRSLASGIKFYADIQQPKISMEEAIRRCLAEKFAAYEQAMIDAQKEIKL